MSELKLADLIYIKKNLLSPSDCATLISECESRSNQYKYEASSNAVTGLIESSTFQSTELIPNSNNFNLVHASTQHMVNEWCHYLEAFKSFNIRVLKNNLNYAHSHRILKYKQGASIHPHIDWQHLTHASCTINLNEDYEGGEFVFFNGRHAVELKQGDAMIWPADVYWIHEVKPVTKGVRYSSNCFILSIPHKSSLDFNTQAKQLSFVNNEFKFTKI